jgi:protein-arginine kinase activator protein McsA
MSDTTPFDYTTVYKTFNEAFTEYSLRVQDGNVETHPELVYKAHNTAIAEAKRQLLMELKEWQTNTYIPAAVVDQKLKELEASNV